jgi:hypothetical protein
MLTLPGRCLEFGCLACQADAYKAFWPVFASNLASRSSKGGAGIGAPQTVAKLVERAKNFHFFDAGRPKPDR